MSRGPALGRNLDARYGGRKWSHMHTQRRIEAIGSTLEEDSIPSLVRAAVKAVEASTPIGAILSTLANEDYLAAVIEAAEGRDPIEEDAWLTLAAVGASRVREILAWRATDLLDPQEVAGLLFSHSHEIKAACKRRAEASQADAQWGAWLLLGHLDAERLARLVRGRPRLRARWQQMRASGRHGGPRRQSMRPVARDHTIEGCAGALAAA